MQKYILLLLSLSITLACEKPESYLDFIDTSIGTGGHGQAYGHVHGSLRR